MADGVDTGGGTTPLVANGSTLLNREAYGSGVAEAKGSTGVVVPGLAEGVAKGSFRADTLPSPDWVEPLELEAGKDAVACWSCVASSVRVRACAGSTAFVAAICDPSVAPSLTARSKDVTNER